VSPGPKLTSDSPTGPKQPGLGENPSAAKSQKSVAIYREFLITELKWWTFKMKDVNGQEHEFTARNCPVETWVAYFSEFADLDPTADWTDIEERADFLTQFWQFCAQESLSFPLTEKLNEASAIS
jgi:hypothetical protein